MKRNYPSSPSAPAEIPVPLLDVNRGNDALREEVLAAIAKVCDSGRFLHGPDCGELEEAVAELCGAAHGVGCASGSDALLLALMALGIGPGDEVIVPSFTFFATASCVWRLGANPVFADIDPATFNLDPHHVASRITPRTKAIIPVHLFGQAADLHALCELAHEHGLYVIEDAAQAIGATHRERPVGSWGDVSCFSFYPTKNLGGYGDGGMLTTNDQALADRLRLHASHGMKPRYYHSVVGINSRLDTIQAAILKVKLGALADSTRQRQENAARYQELLAPCEAQGWLSLPACGAGNGHVWNQFTVRVHHGQRDALRGYLSDHKIGSEIYYPVPLHRQQCFRELGYVPGTLPETERAAAEVLSLPIFPELTLEEQLTVVGRIQQFGQQFHRRAA